MNRRGVFALLTLSLLLATSRPVWAQSSWGIGVLPNGSIFFCDRGRNAVWRISPDGRQTAVLQGVTCRAVVSGPDGSIYGEATPSELTAARGVGLWRIDARGLHQWIMPLTRNPDIGAGLARDEDGRQYGWTGIGVGSPQSEIIQRDPSGAVVVVAGGAWGLRDGAGRAAALGNVAGLALAPDGSVVVADTGNIRRISRLHVVRTEAAGVVTNSHLGLTTIAGLWGRELGVATDASGAAVVVDPEAGRIVHVDRAGHATPIWEPAGVSQRISGGRWGWRPTGVAMLGRTYYVLDEWMGPAIIADLIGSPRLSQVDADGRVTRIAAIADWTVRAAAAALCIVAVSAVWARRRRRASTRPPM